MLEPDNAHQSAKTNSTNIPTGAMPPDTTFAIKDLSAPTIRTTFSRDLSPMNRSNALPNEVSEIMHQPVGRLVSGGFRQFTLLDPRSIPLAKILPRLPQTFACELGTLEIFLDSNQRRIELIAHGPDSARLARGLDCLRTLLDLDTNNQIIQMRLLPGGRLEHLSRSTFSLLLAKTGFEDAYPELSAALMTQFALEQPNGALLNREKLAYREFELTKIGDLLESGKNSLALEEVLKLKDSKGQELRRMGSQMLPWFLKQKIIGESDYRAMREDFFMQDVREDMVFVERTIRNSDFFVKHTFQNLFGQSPNSVEIAGSIIDMRYFARGCNKQVYTIDWEMPNKQKYKFAITTIRDAQLGQGDFDEERITQSLRDWNFISYEGCPGIVKLGASEWICEWRNRNLHTTGNLGPVIQLYGNQIMISSREFIEDAVPLVELLQGPLNNEEKHQAMAKAAQTYFDVWRFTRTKDGLGYFLTTPRAEDIVLWRDKQGAWGATIVDMDTLVSNISLPSIKEYFKSYGYYPEQMLQQMFAEDR